MTRNNADFQGGVNKFYAAATQSGTYHAHTNSAPNGEGEKALCGATVYPEHDNPVARLDEDEYASPMQWVECAKCEKTIRKSRGL
jgi:hypothetical protein